MASSYLYNKLYIYIYIFIYIHIVFIYILYIFLLRFLCYEQVKGNPGCTYRIIVQRFCYIMALRLYWTLILSADIACGISSSRHQTIKSDGPRV